MYGFPPLSTKEFFLFKLFIPSFPPSLLLSGFIFCFYIISLVLKLKLTKKKKRREGRREDVESEFSFFLRFFIDRSYFYPLQVCIASALWTCVTIPSSVNRRREGGYSSSFYEILVFFSLPPSVQKDCVGELLTNEVDIAQEQAGNFVQGVSINTTRVVCI